MTTFTLTIELGNDAMRSPAELLAAVELSMRDVVAFWDDGPLSPGEYGRIRDENGNTVGNWEVTGE